MPWIAGGPDFDRTVLEERIDLDLPVGTGAEHLLEKADTVLRRCLGQLWPALRRQRPPEVREVHHGIVEFSGIQREESRETARTESGLAPRTKADPWFERIASYDPW